MSTDFHDDQPDGFGDDFYDEDEGGTRRHAAWALTVLALAAVVIIALISIVVGTSPSKKTPVAEPTDTATSATGSSTSSSGSPSTTAASSSPAASSSASTSAAAPGSKRCPTAAPCVIPGDDGRALDAANALRRRSGLPGVPGSVTPNAQQCALDQGSGPTCVPHFAWQPLSSQDGAACVAAISPSWILDPAVKTFSVGWALIGGQWQCAMLKAP